MATKVLQVDILDEDQANTVISIANDMMKGATVRLFKTGNLGQTCAKVSMFCPDRGKTLTYESFFGNTQDLTTKMVVALKQYLRSHFGYEIRTEGYYMTL